MATGKCLAFYEGNFLVKTLSTDDEREQAYRLRHKVFAERLKWVKESPDELEIDAYDRLATNLGLFTESGKLCGISRLLSGTGPYMLEKEFKSFLTGATPVRKERDAAEITRLTVDPMIQEKGLSSRMMLAIFKGIYQWSLLNEVRYCYMVVEKRFLRVLRVLGFPCEPISPYIALPPADALSVAALLDWDRFRAEIHTTHPGFLDWISAIEVTTQVLGTAASRKWAASFKGTASMAMEKTDEQLVVV